MKQLQFLMESELLTADVKTQLTEAVTEMKKEFEGKLSAEYAEKMVAENEKLDKEIKELINEAVTSEMSELKEDVAKYRKLEIEYAAKLEDFKEEYAAKLNEAVETLVVESVTEEIKEMHEDLLEAKKDDFGKRIFEAFSDEFSENGFGGDMKALNEELKESRSKLSEALETADLLENEKVKTKLLSNLTGKKQKVMETLLEGVATGALEEKYNASVEFVLEDKPEKKLDESDDKEKPDGDRIDLNESVRTPEEKSRLNKLLGRNV